MSLSSDKQWNQLSGYENNVVAKDRNDFAAFGEGNMNGVSKHLPSPHIMPHPTGLPWNIHDMSWSMTGPQSGVVEFTATPFDIQNRNKKLNTLHCKRKSDMQLNIPAKQLITEEKMSAYFNGMHISEGGIAPPCDGNDNEEDAGGMEVESSQLHLPAAQRLKGAQRLVLSEEMLRMRADSILPDSLFNRLEKPCTSLVLWQPPKRLISEDLKDTNNNPEQSNSSLSSRQRKGLLANNISNGYTSTSTAPVPSSMDMDM